MASNERIKQVTINGHNAIVPETISCGIIEPGTTREQSNIGEAICEIIIGQNGEIGGADAQIQPLARSGLPPETDTAGDVGGAEDFIEQLSDREYIELWGSPSP